MKHAGTVRFRAVRLMTSDALSGQGFSAREYARPPTLRSSGRPQFLPRATTLGGRASVLASRHVAVRATPGLPDQTVTRHRSRAGGACAHDIGTRCAFTLIELLVVIAIIAVLAAILFPVFAKARENARATTCRSNLKQIGTAIDSYTQDWDELLPARFLGTEEQSWRTMIQPYIKSRQVFKCPSISSPKVVIDKDTGKIGNVAGFCFDGVFPVSYAVNGNDDQTKLGGPTPMPSDYGRPLAQIQYPSQLVMVMDSNYPYAEAPGGFEPDVLFVSHNERANFLYGDWHVKARKPISTATPINEWTLDQSPASPALIEFLRNAGKNPE